jgi:DNA modification methylase
VQPLRRNSHRPPSRARGLGRQVAGTGRGGRPTYPDERLHPVELGWSAASQRGSGPLTDQGRLPLPAPTGLQPDNSLRADRRSILSAVGASSQGGSTIKTNVLYYGDNLDILRRYIPDESVDLVYLDPPFNSDRNYNVIFKDESGRQSDGEILAFEDTWHWGPNAEATYAFLTETARHQGRIPDTVSTIIAALHRGIGANQMMAYLVEMAVRLVELRRVLKPTGGLYLHCDPTASHYLKVVLDAIFGPEHFRNEVIWKRSHGHNSANRYGASHDVLLFYGKTERGVWNRVFQGYDPEYLDKHYRHVDADGRRYKHENPTGAGISRGVTGQPWRGIDPTAKGRHWARGPEEMDRLDAEGLIHWPDKPGAWPYIKLYLDDMGGVPAQDLWADIAPINMVAKERLGYPTQKPLALLERIISASSNSGDVVLDPFCGCGTALVAAQKLDRKWIGIDVTYLSIAVMRARLKDTFGLADVEVIGQPTEVEGARQLAQSPEGRYQFQWWALGLVDAQPVGGVERKGADRGIDGRITFTGQDKKLESVLVSVKSGHVNSGQVRDLKGTLEREKAAMGIFVTLEEPTREMRLEATTAGMYRVWERDYPKIQIVSIRELLEEGRKPALPPLVLPTFQQAQRERERGGEQMTIDQIESARGR